MPKTKLMAIHGKSLPYWEKQATDLIISVLLRGYFLYEGKLNSPAQKLAANRLFNLALIIDSYLTRKQIEEYNNCQAGIVAIINDVTLHGIGCAKPAILSKAGLIPRTNHESANVARQSNRRRNRTRV